MELSNPVPTSQPWIEFSTLQIGTEIPVKKFLITRGDLVNYAGVAGDPNPIHFSDLFAQKADLPGVIAHGMLTMGLVAGYITDWLGNPAALREYSVRFTNPIVVPADSPAEIEVAAKVKSLDEQTRQAHLILTVQTAGVKVFGKATAIVDLA